MAMGSCQPKCCVSQLVLCVDLYLEVLSQFRVGKCHMLQWMPEKDRAEYVHKRKRPHGMSPVYLLYREQCLKAVKVSSPGSPVEASVTCWVLLVHLQHKERVTARFTR